jgi:hypothetical protein
VSSQDDLDRRYARGRGRWAAFTGLSPVARLFLTLAGMVVLGLVIWFVLTVVWNADPSVSSAIKSWDVTDDNHVRVTVDINAKQDVDLSKVVCTVDAQAKDHSVVGGPTTYTPTSNGVQTFTLPTTRRAVNVDWNGCTAPGQTDPR